ncbi:MAG: glycoside hydrolase family 3 protein [Deltaproteobacteria bacterium]|nr:glycoside hydrolase family 3 protein [Deltaproteobacteria bacterium]
MARLMFFLISPLLLLGLAWHLDWPVFYAWRTEISCLALGISLVLAFWSKKTLKKKQAFWSLTLLLLVVLSFLAKSFEREYLRLAIWQASAEEIKKMGAHFVIGYRDWEEASLLARQGAIAGLYISRAQFREYNFEDLQNKINQLQGLRQKAGLPPLIIAVDEEGDFVSVLKVWDGPQLGLASFSTWKKPWKELEGAIEKMGHRQGKRLKELGVNVNFSPVVDLKVKLKQGRRDNSRIYLRAAAEDPKEVSQRALLYSQTLLEEGVTPTLKHFPGLGHGLGDTHFEDVFLESSWEELKEKDVLPFKQILSQVPALTMLSHAKVAGSKKPASICPQVVEKMFRQKISQEALLITDDFSMAPIALGPGGVSQATVEALELGVDLILISKDVDLYYPAFNAALKAWRQRKLSPIKIALSQNRLQKLVKNF